MSYPPVIILLLSLTLTACGFTLRGYGDSAMLPDSLREISIDDDGGNSDTRNALRTQLRGGGATLVEDAPYSIRLTGERTEERIISLDSTARAGEYALTLIITFELREGTETVLGPEQINLEQSYQADPQNAIAKQQESELILEEMRRDAARRIVSLLQRFEPADSGAAATTVE